MLLDDFVSGSAGVHNTFSCMVNFIDLFNPDYFLFYIIFPFILLRALRTYYGTESIFFCKNFL